MKTQLLSRDFFDQPAQALAKALLGKLIRHRVKIDRKELWLCARIIETEAYELEDKASHSSLGFTEKRRALFMPAGTLYMYYARGKDSLNFSAKGDGNAVLIKSGIAHMDRQSNALSLKMMQQLNPMPKGPRPVDKLCSGQTLLCRSLNLKVVDWDQQTPVANRLRIEQDSYSPSQLIACRRLGISESRDAHLMYRFIDKQYASRCTSNPLGKKHWIEGRDYLFTAF